MDCVNHAGATATAYCQSCGKAMCPACVRNAAGGQVLCEPCWASWNNYRQPFAPAQPGVPNPSAAAVLGLIPGVGAMYNGQFFKGLIHVVIFAVLVSMADHYGIFGLFIAAWILYQSFEAYHTARARRDGQPLPDPLGLNELGSWLNLGSRPPVAGQPQAAADVPPAGQAPYAPPYGAYPIPPVPPIPPIPPVPPPFCWRRREPVGAIVLIGLGILFLLGRLDFFSFHVFEYSWPLGLIGLGVWLIVRRVGDQQGGPK